MFRFNFHQWAIVATRLGVLKVLVILAGGGNSGEKQKRERRRKSTVKLSNVT